jgi:hypothetical protein
MCVACATPVRGRAYGAECLGAVLGPDAALAAASVPRPPDTLPRALARLGFALAVAATALPWSRFGPGSEAFGAWSRSGRWSIVAAVAAVLGLVASLAQRSPRLRTSGWDVTLAAIGAGVAAAALLAVAFPAAFSRPWLGPWVAAAGGTLACGAAVAAIRAQPPQVVRI